MIIETLLPIRNMEIPDWKAIHSGFIIGWETDTLAPSKNVFSSQIISYLLNTELQLSDYTNQYYRFSFSVTAVVDSSFTIKHEGVRILDQGDNELVLELEKDIDAPRFAKVDKHEALRMIAQLLLDSIPKYLFGRTDFDGQKFYDDVLPIIQPIADGTRTFQDEEFPL